MSELEKHSTNNLFTGAILMELSKAFHCILLDLLIAKLHAYGLGFCTLIFLYSYLKDWKWKVQIDNIYSLFKLVLFGVPQGSVLGPILSNNIFLNDLFLRVQNLHLHNFAEDNTVPATWKKY